jgi:succinate-semialdehyde dehydrogenase/glutarate-semialdehyde dehydrogenase
VYADRIFVENQIYDQFAQALVDAVEKLRVGDGFESGVQIGLLINMAAVEKIERQVEEALSKGAKLLCGGKRHSLGKTFYEPTVLSNVKPEMRIGQEETFGPVAPLIRFKREAEAIEMANDTEYGLASYLYTRDPDRIWRVAEQLENGIVSVNSSLFANEVTPFGGVKQSGLGREGSKYGLDEFLEMKYICMGSAGN